MKRFFSFFEDSYKLGLSKNIILISILFYLGSVFFEAVGLSLILPIFSIIFEGEGSEIILGNSQFVDKMFYYMNYIGIPSDKYSLIILLIIVILLRQFMVFSRTCWSAAMIAKIVYGLRIKTFSDFLVVKEDFFKKSSAGRTLNDLSLEVTQAATIMIKGLDIIGIITMFFCYLIIMFMLSAQLTFFALISFLLSIIILKGLWSKSAEVGRLITTNNREFMTYITQRFSSLRLLKLTANNSIESNLLNKITSEQRNRQFKAGFLLSLTNSCIEPIIFILGAFILYGAISLFDQNLSNIGLFSLIMIRGIPLARSGFSAWQGIEGKWASLKAVSNMLENLSQNQEDYSGKIIIGDKPPEICLENLYFEYEDRKKSVIDSVSLDIKSGSMVALVGPSGAGKSTLIDFIPRLKVPIKGKILLDGVNINDINVEYLRSKIAFLPQAPQILEGSIRDHVSFGNPGILDVDILKALQKAGCEDLLMKIDHNLALGVGEAGVLLSGGERQRLDLARVLARKASILILDEPSSNLDPLTEKIIHDAIIKENKERLLTVIVIGHRLKFLNSFDQIIVLNNGSIEFKGIHTEALKQSTWYKNAWKLQE